MESITVKQAIEQGYVDYVYDNDGYQRLKNIADDVKDGSIDFSRKDLSVVNKVPSHPQAMDADEIAELLAEQMQSWYSEETDNETDSVYNAIKSLDFSDVEKMIKEKLSMINYYRSTGIRLIP